MPQLTFGNHRGTTLGKGSPLHSFSPSEGGGVAKWLLATGKACWVGLADPCRESLGDLGKGLGGQGSLWIPFAVVRC